MVTGELSISALLGGPLLLQWWAHCSFITPGGPWLGRLPRNGPAALHKLMADKI